MNELNKSFEKWMVIPYNKDLYEKYNTLPLVTNQNMSNEEKNIKYNDSLSKITNTYSTKTKPEAISKLAPESSTKFNQSDIKPEELDESILNASFNETKDLMDLEEEPFKNDIKKEPSNLNKSIIGKKNKPKKLKNVKRINISNNKLKTSHVKDFLDTVYPKIEINVPATNTRSKSIKRLQEGKNIINWTIYKNIY
jgi:hypothetical protein